MKIGIVIGRFQGFHKGHMHLLNAARASCDKLVVLLGSCNRAPSIKNPFTAFERIETIKRNVPMTVWRFEELNDYAYNDEKWKEQVNAILSYYKLQGDVVLFGHNKEGNDYLEWFPDIEYQEIEAVNNSNGTEVREQLFEMRDKRVEHLQDDWDYFKAEKEKFASYPYPETLNFCCADAVVECMGHVLLIKRKNSPGKGLWALPGGFKNNSETYLDCAIRELIEETGIKVFQEDMYDNVVQSKMFDSPKRGGGIPRNTTAVHINLNCTTLPEIVAQDDASDVQWVALDKIGKGEFKLHDDHQDIIFSLINSK